MKKSLVILMGLLSLSVFAACGSNADADIDADNLSKIRSSCAYYRISVD
jgi:hypothetical protein